MTSMMAFSDAWSASSDQVIDAFLFTYGQGSVEIMDELSGAGLYRFMQDRL